MMASRVLGHRLALVLAHPPPCGPEEGRSERAGVIPFQFQSCRLCLSCCRGVPIWVTAAGFLLPHFGSVTRLEGGDSPKDSRRPQHGRFLRPSPPPAARRLPGETGPAVRSG